jgi:deoxyribose-phosphate aldolase
MTESPAHPSFSSAEIDDLVARVARQVLQELAQTSGGAAASSLSSMAELLGMEPDRVGTLPRWAFDGSLGERELARVPAPSGGARELARIIDHTLLKPDATPRQISALCEEALHFGFRTVCINSVHVAQAARELRRAGPSPGAPVVCAVVGFPLGATLSDVKAYEARRAIEEGATEIDMVLAVGMVKAGREGFVVDDIAQVCGAVPRGTVVKVILETALLTESEKRLACRLAREAGATYVKTSTGFLGGGAAADDLRLMREEVGRSIGVKASGGIRTAEDAWRMVLSGASRIGASASVAIVGGRALGAAPGY